MPWEPEAFASGGISQTQMPVSQSCAVAKSNKFWRASGQSNLADKSLVSVLTQPHCSLPFHPSSSFQSLLTSYGACSTKTKAWKGPILRWFWLVIWNAIQYNKSAICGLLEPVLSRALRFRQACAVRNSERGWARQNFSLVATAYDCELAWSKTYIHVRRKQGVYSRSFRKGSNNRRDFRVNSELVYCACKTRGCSFYLQELNRRHYGTSTDFQMTYFKNLFSESMNHSQGVERICASYSGIGIAGMIRIILPFRAWVDYRHVRTS